MVKVATQHGTPATPSWLRAAIAEAWKLPAAHGLMHVVRVTDITQRAASELNTALADFSTAARVSLTLTKPDSIDYTVLVMGLPQSRISQVARLIRMIVYRDSGRQDTTIRTARIPVPRTNFNLDRLNETVRHLFHADTDQWPEHVSLETSSPKTVSPESVSHEHTLINRQ